MVVRVEETPQPPARDRDGHKGTFGRVLVIAGSRGMSGAACLSGLSALRGGSGLVALAIPKGIQSIVAGYEPSYLTVALDEDADGRIAGNSQSILASHLDWADAVASGPGWGRSAELSELMAWLFASLPKCLVIDADGLNLIADNPEILKTQTEFPRILTPHPGEFARLSGQSIGEIQKNREEFAVEFARKHQVILVLKGSGTVITDGEKIAVNSTGNSGLATGGTGDVLTGLMASLCGQGLPAFQAAQLAVHVHGLAADLAVKDLSERGLMASDLPKYLARVWNMLE